MTRLRASLTDEHRKPNKFTPEYKNSVFLEWYNLGRPNPQKFALVIKPDNWGNQPTKVTLDHWIHEDFKEKADLLDQQVEEEMNKRLIQQKIEMLTRHAQVGRDMQKRAIAELEKLETLSEAGSIRLLEFGARLERESAGIPEMLKDIMKLTDEQLVQKIQDLVTKSPSSQLILEANTDDE